MEIGSTKDRFKNCKLLGIKWSLVESLRAPVFENSNLSLGSFRGLHLKALKRTGSRVHEADFQGMDLSGANFSESDFLGTVFNKCNFSKANFRTAKNYQIDPRNNKMTGAKFSLPEAVGLLTGFGIELS